MINQLCTPPRPDSPPGAVALFKNWNPALDLHSAKCRSLLWGLLCTCPIASLHRILTWAGSRQFRSSLRLQRVISCMYLPQYNRWHLKIGVLNDLAVCVNWIFSTSVELENWNSNEGQLHGLRGHVALKIRMFSTHLFLLSTEEEYKWGEVQGDFREETWLVSEVKYDLRGPA